MWSLVKAIASEQVAHVGLREIFVLPATDPIFDLKVGSQFWSLDLEKEAFKYVRIFLKELTLIRINPKTQIINEIEHLRSHRGPPERNGVIHISYFPESIEVSHNLIVTAVKRIRWVYKKAIQHWQNMKCKLWNRVFQITPFFELSYTLLTTHAHGLYEVTKKFQRYRQ